MLGKPGYRVTYIILHQVFDAPSVATWQLHHFTLQPSLCGIASDGLGANTGAWLVIGRNPWRQALVGHFSREVSIYGGEKLVVKVFFLAIGRGEDRVDALRVFGLVESACETRRLEKGQGIGVGQSQRRRTERTQNVLCGGIFVGGPLLSADCSLEGGIERL